MTQELEKNVSGNNNLPLSRLFKIPATEKILDLLLEGYNMQFTNNEIAELTELSLKDTEVILKNLLSEKIIKKEKMDFDVCYSANITAKRTAGLFEYVRATLDENFESNLRTV